MVGQQVGGVRLPLVDATEDEKKQLRGTLEQLGLA